MMACKEPKKAIHGTALAAAGIVALLPIGIDAWALRLCEIYMLMSIYAHYKIKITKSAAESLMTAAFAQAVGEAAAYVALEAADTAAYATGGLGAPAAYAIKLGIATALIEAIGWTTVKHIEGNKIASAAIRVADGIGVAADVSRVVGAVTATSKDEPSRRSEISFTGTPAEIKAAAKKVEYWEKELAHRISSGTSQAEIDSAKRILKGAISDYNWIVSH